MFMSLVRAAMHSVLSLAVVLAMAPAHAAPKVKKWTPAEFQHQAETALARPITMGDSLYLMALNGASKDSLAAIYKDYQNRTAKAEKPLAMKLVKGKLFAGGKPTGIEFSSYAPGVISFNGRKWTYDAQKPADQNYFALIKFLEAPKDAASPVSWLLPEANAQIDRVQYALDGVMLGWSAGAVVGIFASLVACLAAAPVCAIAGVAMGLGGAFAGGFLGGAYGASVYDQTHGVTGRPTIECTEKGMKISNWNIYVREINYDRASGNVNAQMVSMPLGMNKETKAALREIGESCHNVADASKIMSTMDPAAKTVKEIIMSATPAPAPAPEAPAASDS